MGIPMAAKKTDNPPQINVETRAQFRTRMSPIPVAIPKIAKPIVNPRMARMAFFTKGGTSEELAEKVFNNVPKNASEQHKRTKRPARMATTAAAMTEGEAFNEPVILVSYLNRRATRSAETPASGGHRGEKSLGRGSQPSRLLSWWRGL